MATERPVSSGIITIDLDAIARNWQSLQTLVGSSTCAAVVKADAYGLGAERVIPALVGAGCRNFFVATFNEAEQAARLSADGRVFLLNGIMDDNAQAAADLGVIPVLSTPEEISLWRACAERRGAKLRAAIQIDSGLNRLGLSPEDLQALSRHDDAFAGLDVVLVMSHLASADNPDAPENMQQRLSFLDGLKRCPAAPASLAASDGLMLGPDYHFDLVRPGYALYGGQAFQGRPTPVESVVTATSKIMQLRRLKQGDRVGYSHTFCAKSAMTIAIVAAGYGDGVSRAASASTGEARGQVAVAGQLAPIIGRVSMDLIAIDVSQVPAQYLTRGSVVELIGPAVSLEAAGRAAGTIGYEILTRLSPRFDRIYVQQSET